MCYECVLNRLIGGIEHKLYVLLPRVGQCVSECVPTRCIIGVEHELHVLLLPGRERLSGLDGG